MNQICFTVPSIRAGQTIGVAVDIDGKQHFMDYRVESVPWPEYMSVDQRIQGLRKYINSYDEGWELVQIGPPSGELVPVTFRQRGGEGKRVRR